MKSILFFIIFVLYPRFITFHSVQNQEFLIEVKQRILGDRFSNLFKINNNRITIYKCLQTNEKTEIKMVYSRKLKKSEQKKIFELCEPTFNLRNEYIKSVLGGAIWEIKIFSNNRIKNIVIHSHFVYEIDTLFNEINNIIPHKKPKLVTEMFHE